MAEQVTFRLEQFEGPLDLLLHLLSKNKIDMKDIPVAEILEQYLEYLDRMRALDIEVTGDFIAMAAQLIYIKSRMLLPVYESDDPEDPRAQLVETLLDYQRVKEAGALLLTQYAAGRDLYTRAPEPQGEDPDRLYLHTSDQLLAAVHTILERAGRKLPPPASSFRGLVEAPRVSVEEKIGWLTERLRAEGQLTLEDVILASRDRSEAVAVFLAILELSFDGKILIEANNNDQYTIVGTEGVHGGR